MSTFNRFLGKMSRGVKKVTNKVTGKVEQTYDNAAASVRAKTLAIHIDEQYENLGRIVYRDLHTEEDLEEQKLEIIASIDAMFDELEAIKVAREAQKTEKEAKKAAKEAEKAACNACECECECEESCEKSCEESPEPHEACDAQPAEEQPVAEEEKTEE